MPKVVLANGCFDPLHYGHLLHLHAAKKLGDVLVVSVTRNEYVNKGPGRPVFDEEERLAMVKALWIVDAAILCNDSLDALQEVMPDIFVKDQEYEGKIQQKHLEFCFAHGIKIKFTKTRKFSSTKLLSHYGSGQG